MPRALVGRSAEAGPDFAVMRAVDWLRLRGLEVNRELWEGVYEIATTAKRPSVRLKARQMILDRVDPLPRAPVVAVEAGDIQVTWALPAPSSSPTSPAPSKPASTLSLDTNGHARPSSSVTDDLENL